MADSQTIQRVLINLLSNAVKYNSRKSQAFVRI